MSEDAPSIGPGRIVGQERQLRQDGTTDLAPVRVVDHQKAAYLRQFVHPGGLTIEDVMRILYPEDADAIYDPSRVSLNTDGIRYKRY